MTATLTVADAARLARTDEAEIRGALATGELRNLTRRAVESWARARVAALITPGRQR